MHLPMRGGEEDGWCSYFVITNIGGYHRLEPLEIGKCDKSRLPITITPRASPLTTEKPGPANHSTSKRRGKGEKQIRLYVCI